ncbi:MAG: GntR family transcriptional regulator [Lachnospiraceae bacterium]|nr:GntR family transcriptional regulator [Lachnospiraceae bacterium]
MVVLDLKSSKPIYEQIVEQMKFHVLKGHLKPGDAIPSVRKLALDIAITPGTVAKAYQELERQHIIETIRGKGTFIASKIELKQDESRMEDARKLLRSAILELKVMGLKENEVTDVVKELYKEMSVC